MEIKAAVEEYSYAIKELSPKTQRWYIHKLTTFAQWCSSERITLETVRVADVRRFIQHTRSFINPRTKKPIGSYTVHGYAQVVKIFLNWCGREDGLEDIVRKDVGSRIELPKVDQKVIEIFSSAQVDALFRACERERTKELVERDKAILSVLLYTGIRASELIRLTLDCVHFDKDGSYIKVMGKGRKEREVGLNEKARSALRRYILRFRGKRIVGEDVLSDIVFLSRYGDSLSLTGLDRLVDRLGKWGNIEGVRCSPHTCRHHFAINFLLNGGDVYVLSRLLGHTSVSITEIYLKALKGKEAMKQSIIILNKL